MSCGSPKRHAKLGVRMEVARMVLQAAPQDFDTMFPKVITAVCAGIDLDAEDAPGDPAVAGEGAAAVVSRNALLNAPLESVGGLDRAVVIKCQAVGIRSLGALVQVRAFDVMSRAALTQDQDAQLLADVARYGLSLGMDADSIRGWILKGPK